MNKLSRATQAIKSGQPISQIEEFYTPELGRDDAGFVEKLADRRILEAMSKGEFNDLPFTGKPLPGTWDNSPSLSDEEFISYHLLKKNNVLPEWIEKRKEIFTTYNDACQFLSKQFQKQINNEENQNKTNNVKKQQEEPEQSFWGRLFGLAENQQPSKQSFWSRFFGFSEYSNIKNSKQKLSDSMSLEESEKIFRTELEKANKLIAEYNLMVPMTAQLYPWSIEYEIQTLKEKYKTPPTTPTTPTTTN